MHVGLEILRFPLKIELPSRLSRIEFCFRALLAV